MELNSIDLKKYSRQLILKNIGVAGQKKIFESKILIVGAGGLGCPLMLYLSYSGVGNLGIVEVYRIAAIRECPNSNNKSNELEKENYLPISYLDLRVLINELTAKISACTEYQESF